jgi:transposase-like protein
MTTRDIQAHLLYGVEVSAAFPKEEAALKLVYLAFRNARATWEIVQHWKSALNQFEVRWGDRIRAAMSNAT